MNPICNIFTISPCSKAKYDLSKPQRIFVIDNFPEPKPAFSYAQN